MCGFHSPFSVCEREIDRDVNQRGKRNMRAEEELHARAQQPRRF